MLASPTPVLRTMTWSVMGDAERAALCDRGLQAIFDADLKAAIARKEGDIAALKREIAKLSASQPQ